jgi:hypothetical protein
MGDPLEGEEEENTIQRRKERAKPKSVERVEIVWPNWAGPRTLRAWDEFKAYRKSEKKAIYRSPQTEQRAVNILAKYFTNGAECVAALEHAQGKGWMFPVDPADYKYPKIEGADAASIPAPTLKPWLVP